MAEIDETAEKVRRLAELVAEHGLTEITVEEDGVTITVKSEITSGLVSVPIAPQVYAVAPPAVPSTAAPAGSQAAAAGPVRSPKAIPLESPMVGVYYRSPSPEDPPFVNIGDIVHIGQPIGLIEAMKVYSEVPAEASGRVLEIPVENGKLVQQGQPLMFLEPM